MRPIEYWQELTTTDFAALDTERTIALLPVAAIEQHGPHLPLSTDLVINRGIVTAAVTHLDADIRCLLMPELAIGASLEHTDYPGTLSLSAETLLTQWWEVGRGVARTGLRKLVIFNSHGGQQGLVDQAALRLRAEEDMLVVRASYFRLGTPAGLFDPDELAFGLHGGEVETSLMLCLRPDLVHSEALAQFNIDNAGIHSVLGPERPVGYGWMSQDLNPAGVCGNAARADAQRGQRLLDYLGQRLAEVIVATAKMPLRVLRPGPLSR
jgi:creatinine amidohydrolase